MKTALPMDFLSTPGGAAEAPPREDGPRRCGGTKRIRRAQAHAEMQTRFSEAEGFPTLGRNYVSFHA